MTELEDKVKRAAGIVGGLATVGALVVQVQGRPVKDKSQPAKVTAFRVLPLFERTPEGRQYVLWFRIRDVRR